MKKKMHHDVRLCGQPKMYTKLSVSPILCPGFILHAVFNEVCSLEHQECTNVSEVYIQYVYLFAFNQIGQ